jgi:hypothetical protein
LWSTIVMSCWRTYDNCITTLHLLLKYSCTILSFYSELTLAVRLYFVKYLHLFINNLRQYLSLFNCTLHSWFFTFSPFYLTILHFHNRINTYLCITMLNYFFVVLLLNTNFLTSFVQRRIPFFKTRIHLPKLNRTLNHGIRTTIFTHKYSEFSFAYIFYREVWYSSVFMRVLRFWSRWQQQSIKRIIRLSYLSIEQ